MKYVIEMSEDEYKLFERDCINNGWRKTIEKAKPLQAELEEIAKEFTEQNIQVMVWGNGVVPLVDLRDCVKILDNRIAELKGE